MRLDPLGLHQQHAMTSLASALSDAGNVQFLRLRWTSDKMLASFLATVFGQNESVATLEVDDESGRDRDSVTATVWNNFWKARKGMRNVDMFSFTHCKNAALTSSVIQNAPINASHLSLRGCDVDLTGAMALCRQMERASGLRHIDLSKCFMKKPDLMHVAKGVKHTKTLLTLTLADLDLDTGSVVALSEALKFNRSLTSLDLSGNSLDVESCKALGLALALNKTIHSVALHRCQMSATGLEDLQRIKRENVTLLGVPPRKD